MEQFEKLQEWTRRFALLVAKLGIVLEEAGETAFWLEWMQDAGIFPEEKWRATVQEAKELVASFVASVREAKGFTSSIYFLTSDFSYIISSLLILAIGCCITSSSFFTRFSP